MSVITVDFGTRQRGPAPLIRTRLPEPTPTISTPTEWWTCPDFCDRTCWGGHTYTWPNGWTDTAARRHYTDTYTRTLDDTDDNNDIALAAGVVCAEDPDEGHLPPVVRLELNDGRANVTPDEAEEYANAILAAVALARQPLPALDPRSPSQGGGRASTPLESA